MAKLFELACRTRENVEFINFDIEAREERGWTVTDVRDLDIGDEYDSHIRFLCDHDWYDTMRLAATIPGCHYIEQTVMPLNIYDGRRRTSIGHNPDDHPEFVWEHTIPMVQFVHGGDVVWDLPLEAMIPPLSGKELKERALQNKLVSLTYLSGKPLEDEDTIVAPSIVRGECPKIIVFNCERVRKTRLRGKQNPMNGFKPY